MAYPRGYGRGHILLERDVSENLENVVAISLVAPPQTLHFRDCVRPGRNCVNRWLILGRKGERSGQSQPMEPANQPFCSKSVAEKAKSKK